MRWSKTVRSGRTYAFFEKRDATYIPVTLSDVADIEVLNQRSYTQAGLYSSYLAYRNMRTEDSQLVFAGNLYLYCRILWSRREFRFHPDWTSTLLLSLFQLIPDLVARAEASFQLSPVQGDQLEAYIVPALRTLRRRAQMSRTRWIARESRNRGVPHDFSAHPEFEGVETRVLLRDEVESIEDRVLAHCRVRRRLYPAVRYLVRCFQHNRPPSLAALISTYGAWRVGERTFLLSHVPVLCRALLDLTPTHTGSTSVGRQMSNMEWFFRAYSKQ